MLKRGSNGWPTLSAEPTCACFPPFPACTPCATARIAGACTRTHCSSVLRFGGEEVGRVFWSGIVVDVVKVGAERSVTINYDCNL